MFSQNSHLHNGLDPFKKKKKSFQNGLEKSIFSFLKNQGTQPRSQIKVHNRDHKSRYTTTIPTKKKIWVVCENIKSFPTYCFRVVTNT